MTKIGTVFGSVPARRVMGCVAIAALLFLCASCGKDDISGPSGRDPLLPNETNVVYVNATIGSDDYDGLSPTYEGSKVGPKKTIQAGISASQTGYVCKVAPGVYPEHIVMKAGVKLEGAGADVTTIDGGDIRGSILVIMNCHGDPIVISGFTITNGSCYGDNAGIRIQDSDDVTIRNNLITGNRADGIRIYSASPAIINNTIARNGRNGVMVDLSCQPRIVNNIIVDNNIAWPSGSLYGWGLYASNSGIINSSHNDVWRHNNNYGSDSGGVSSPGMGDMSCNPMFINADAGDFRLAAGSPCIDAGIDVGLEYRGDAPDMGAFEHEKRKDAVSR